MAGHYLCHNYARPLLREGSYEGRRAHLPSCGVLSKQLALQLLHWLMAPALVWKGDWMCPSPENAKPTMTVLGLPECQRGVPRKAVLQHGLLLPTDMGRAAFFLRRCY